MNSPEKIKIVMGDDHNSVHQSFISFFNGQSDMSVIGEAENGIRLIEVIEKTQPNIALIDFDMPVLNGLDTLKTIVHRKLNVRPIIFTFHKLESIATETLMAGARAFVSKGVDMDQLLQTIRNVHLEGFDITPKLSRQIISRYEKSNKGDSFFQAGLTERELEVLKLLCEEKSSKEIAVCLSLSVDTVKYHKSNIYKKTSASSIVGLVKYAIKYGITDLD